MKPFPFDSLYEEYIPQPAPIYDRVYAVQPAQRVETTVPGTASGGRQQEEVSSARPVETPPDDAAPLTFSERLFPLHSKRLLVLEILLSLVLGIFGVGWLLIGNRRIGTFLLVSSLIVYAPLLIISYALAYFSDGLSILCSGPFIAGAVALNAFLLGKTMQFKMMERSLI